MHNTRISGQVRQLHQALLDIVSLVNRPQADEALIRRAGISLDRALFPLLVSVERFGPVGVVDLADRVGRDYTTVSRQIAKLESLGLVERRGGEADRRIHEAVVTSRGKTMTDAIDSARERIADTVFATWSADDVGQLVRLLRRLANDAAAVVKGAQEG